MHSNVTMKNVSWPHFSWATLYKPCAYTVVFTARVHGPYKAVYGPCTPVHLVWRWASAQSPGPTPTSIPSGILVHPAVWPQRSLAENLGTACPFREGGAESQSNTMSPTLRPITVRSGILIHTTVWYNRHRPKIRGLRSLFGEGAGSPSNTKSLGYGLPYTQWHLDASSRLATI